MIMNSKQVLDSLIKELEQRKCKFLEIGGEAAEIRADECHEHLMLIDRLRQKSGRRHNIERGRRNIILSEKQKAMIVSALCGAVLDLKKAKLEARRNRFKTDDFNREIDAFVELKRYIANDNSDNNTDK